MVIMNETEMPTPTCTPPLTPPLTRTMDLAPVQKMPHKFYCKNGTKKRTTAKKQKITYTQHQRKYQKSIKYQRLGKKKNMPH